LTVKLTSLSARTPPNRNDTPRASNVVSTKPSRKTGAVALCVFFVAIAVTILYRPRNRGHATIHVSRRWHTRCQVLDANCGDMRPTSPLGERPQ
jgi:hypothetical protein